MERIKLTMIYIKMQCTNLDHMKCYETSYLVLFKMN